MLVLFQMSGIFLVFWPWDFRFLENLFTAGVCVTGALLGGSALFKNRPGNFRIAPEPRQNTELVRTGPYRWIRHPMYAAVLLAMGGICLYNRSWWNYFGFFILSAAVWMKAIREEALLAAKFDEYTGYMQRTRRFIPFVF